MPRSFPGTRTYSRSISLSGPASPRATDPKTDNSAMPYFWHSSASRNPSALISSMVTRVTPIADLRNILWRTQRSPSEPGIYPGLVLELNSLDLEEIAVALADQTDYEHRWLINTETGEIVFWTSDTGIDGQTAVDLDELDLLCIDPLPSSIWYQDMAEFAAHVSDERAGRRLARAIQGKGAFRRFRAELHEEFPQLLPAWYAFRDARAHRRAVEWLA